MKKQEIAMLELRGDRLILIQKFGKMNASQVEVDVTGVWHFFKDYQEYLSTPSTLCTTEKVEPDTNDPSQFPADGNDMLDYK